MSTQTQNPGAPLPPTPPVRRSIWSRLTGARVKGPTGQKVNDYERYVEGNFEPYLGKWIDTLIAKQETFIVYLDQDCLVEWAYTDAYGKPSPAAAEILNGISELEATSLSGLPRGTKVAFHRMLGEAVARILEKTPQAQASATRMLKSAEAYIKAIHESVARTWNLQSTLATATVFVVAALVLWSRRDTVRSAFGPGALDLALMSAAGVVGGFLSYASRSRQIDLDASGGRLRYYFNGVARSLGAAAGAVFVGLAVKMRLVLGFLNELEGMQLTGLLLAGMLAGVSERLVPNLAADIAGKTAQQEAKDARQEAKATPKQTEPGDTAPD